jgi:hypothetical protein
VYCETVQRAVFTHTTKECGGLNVEGGEEVGGKEDGMTNGSDVQTSDEAEDEEEEGGGVRLPASFSSPLGSTTNVANANDAAGLSPQAYGLRVARQREQVRQAARRGVAFGFHVAREGGDGVGAKEEERKRVEAVQDGRVVETSFAKGEWGVRWRG